MCGRGRGARGLVWERRVVDEREWLKEGCLRCVGRVLQMCCGSPALIKAVRGARAATLL